MFAQKKTTVGLPGIIQVSVILPSLTGLTVHAILQKSDPKDI